MDINPSDYKSVTDKLQIGSVRKVPHKECSNSACLRIENTLEGFTYYCFKCQEYRFSSNYNSPLERLRREKALRAQTKAKTERDYSLPVDFSRDIAPKGLSWLGRAGWTTELLDRYNIGFSVAMNRVILPVVYRGEHKGYTARAIESWQSPKYLELCQDGVMWESSQIGGEDRLQFKDCVICEDILSAGRCGVVMKAYSILGTSLDTAQLSEFMKYDTIYLWLDNDKGGRTGIKNIVNRLGMFCRVLVVHSEVDPKLLTNKEIKEKLCLLK